MQVEGVGHVGSPPSLRGGHDLQGHRAEGPVAVVAVPARAEVEAHHLLEDPKRAELDARFKALESEEGEDGIEDELAALKAKLGG